MAEPSPLYLGLTTDGRTDRIANLVVHRWVMRSHGLERLCDGWGELDGIGPSLPGWVGVKDVEICRPCTDVYVADMISDTPRFDGSFQPGAIPPRRLVDRRPWISGGW